MVYATWWKRNIYLSMAVHVLSNVVGMLSLLVALLGSGASYPAEESMVPDSEHRQIFQLLLASIDLAWNCRADYSPQVDRLSYHRLQPLT
jgi:hypothetical protein